MGYIKGRVDHIKFHQEGGSFYIFGLKVEATDFTVRDKVASVSGHLCGLTNLRPGHTIHLVGRWVQHRKYGRQFSPFGWFPWAESTQDVARFLVDCVHGFEDWRMASRIAEVFGLETFEALTQDPQRVMEVGNNPVLEGALLEWGAMRGMADLSLFLQDYDLGPETVDGIWAKFGSEAVSIISKNPYRLIAVEGFQFAKADHLASRLGIPRNDPRRIEGAALWVLRTESQQGHLFVRRGDLPDRVTSLAASEGADPFDIPDLYGALMAAVDRLEESRSVRVDPEAGVYLPELFLYERQSAVRLSQFLSPSEIDSDLDKFLLDYQSSNQIELSDAQRDAVRKLVEHRVLVVTGLPGTGKTTIVKTIVRLFRDAQVSFALMAPTGIAAKRLASVVGEEAQTIHRTFGYNGSEWGYHGGNKFGIGAVIVDEMSMVDQELFFRILDALTPSTMLVLVGDDAQLPSVGPGNVLRELISCPEIPNVRLTQIFRQAQTSDIVVASHRINRGESPIMGERSKDSEFQFVQVSDENKIADFIVQAAAKLKDRNANFQVLSPKYEGAVGVNALNEMLREKLNPPTNNQRECKIGHLHVREGDRLMVIKNNYNLNVYNGDMGKLLSIEKDSLLLRIHGIGRNAADQHVHISKDLAPTMLKLAYAITVHKSQGSEFETIILPVVRNQGRMLQRNLLYTAVTRAKKKVWLLGEEFAVHKAIANDKVQQRNTVFGREISKCAQAGVTSAHVRNEAQSGAEEQAR